MPKKPALAAPLSFQEKRQRQTRQERSVPICLNGRLVGDIEAMDRELIEARKSATTLAQQGEVRRKAEAIEAMRAEMERYTEVFRLRGLTWVENQALRAEHPPNPHDAGDKERGYNQNTYYPALIHRCLVSPQMTAEECAEMAAELNQGEFEKLAIAAHQATTGGVSVPFSPAASSVLRNSGETSK